MPLPGRNGFADRVCDNCDNSCHKTPEDDSAEEAPLGAASAEVVHLLSTLSYGSPGLRRNQRRGRAAHWITSRKTSL